MNKNIMIVLAGGFLIAILVAMLVQASLSSSKKKQTVVKKEPKVEIILAAKNMKVGTELTEEHMKWQKWPKEAVFPGAIVREDGKKVTEMLAGRVTRNFVEGEPIPKAATIEEVKENFLAATLEKGHRAYSIKVNSQAMVSGFVGPGDYVDILLTYKFRESISDNFSSGNVEADTYVSSTIDKYATEIIMENVKVLAVDQKANKKQDKAQVGKTITVELNRKGVEILALAQEVGNLSLALRGLGDDEVTGVTRIADNQVTTDYRLIGLDDEILNKLKMLHGQGSSPADLAVVPTMQFQNNSGQDSQIVRIYRGDAVQSLPVAQ